MSDYVMSHMVENPPDVELGMEVVAFCGTVFVVEEKSSTKPVCIDCVKIRENDIRVLTDQYKNMITDLNVRINEIIDALDTSGSAMSWLPVETLSTIMNAYWRPGPALAEGPTMEDGSFFKEKIDG